MSHDPLSDLLQLTDAVPMVTGGFAAGGSWAIRFPAPRRIKFFAVVRGSCWVSIEGVASPMHFTEGDVGLLAAPLSFVLSSDLGVPPVDAMTLFTPSRQGPVRLGSGEDFLHIGGHVLLDPLRGDFLAEALPPWIHIQSGSPEAAICRWLVDQLVNERGAQRPGAQLAAAQLTQLLFLHVLRGHMNSSNLAPAGWLRALNDARIGPALRLLHSQPGHAWSLAELASACAMSRTTFALQFRTVAGVAPLTYLAQLRMRLAQKMLQDQAATVSSVAQKLGYGSESAFSNAFKRHSGSSPSAFRAASLAHSAH